MKGDKIGNHGQERDGKIQPKRAQHTVQLKYQMNEEPDFIAIVILLTINNSNHKAKKMLVLILLGLKRCKNLNKILSSG